MTSKVTYLGGLRTEAQHLASQEIIITDAPKDNQGKGEAFSPTDLVATALASCMITIMGIKARDLGIDLTGTQAEITKIMQQLVRVGVIPEIASIDLDTPITMSPGMTIADAEAALNDESPYNFSKSASPEVKQRVLDRLVQR